MSSDEEEMRAIRAARGLKTRAEQRRDAGLHARSVSLSGEEAEDEEKHPPRRGGGGGELFKTVQARAGIRCGRGESFERDTERRAFSRVVNLERESESEDEDGAFGPQPLRPCKLVQPVERERRQDSDSKECGETSKGRLLFSTRGRVNRMAVGAKRALRGDFELGGKDPRPSASSKSLAAKTEGDSEEGSDQDSNEELAASLDRLTDDDDYLLGLDPGPSLSQPTSEGKKDRTTLKERSQERRPSSDPRTTSDKKNVAEEEDEEDDSEVLDPDAEGAAALRESMGLPCAFGDVRASREATRKNIVRERYRGVAAEGGGSRGTSGQSRTGRGTEEKETSEKGSVASHLEEKQSRPEIAGGSDGRNGDGERETGTQLGRENGAENEERERWRKLGLPVSLEVSVPAHSPSVASAFALNPRANRMVTGGGDGVVRFWDFQGMTSGMRSYRQATPVEKHTVEALAFSTTHVLVAAGDCQLRLYDAQDPSEPTVTTTKGDMYIRDVANTKGHTHKVLDCHFHPHDRNRFISCGLDASVRLWDVNTPLTGMMQTLPHIACLKAVDRRGLNSSATHCTSCVYTPTKASAVVVGCADGSLQMWGNVGSRKNFGRPDGVVRDADLASRLSAEKTRVTGMSSWTGQGRYGGAVSVTGLRAFKDDFRVVSRRVDSKLALWDLRKFTAPVIVAHRDLPTASERAGICLSPDEKLVCVTTQFEGRRPSSNEGKDKCSEQPSSVAGGTIEVFEAQNLKHVASFALPAGVQPLRVEWPEETNQILACCSDGSVSIFFDRDLSTKGALLFVDTPEGRRRREAEMEANMMFAKEYIFVPGQLPEGYKETFDGQIIKVKPRGRERLRLFLESQKTSVPPRPAKEGYAGANVGGGNSSQHLLRKLGLLDSAKLKEEDAIDPVEALRAYAKETEKAGMQSQLISRAYATTQPKTILNTTMEEEDEDELLKTKERCPRCALRMCQCGYMEEMQRLENEREEVSGRKRLKT